MSSEFEKLIAESAEKLKAEYFLLGWKAAFEAMAKMGAESEPPVPEGVSISHGSGLEFKRPKDQKLPPEGTTPYAVLMVVRKTSGLTGGQIVSALREQSHPAPDSSIMTTIQRLKAKKLITLRHGKWYPL